MVYDGLFDVLENQLAFQRVEIPSLTGHFRCSDLVDAFDPAQRNNVVAVWEDGQSTAKVVILKDPDNEDACVVLVGEILNGNEQCFLIARGSDDAGWSCDTPADVSANFLCDFSEDQFDNFMDLVLAVTTDFDCFNED